MSKITAFVYISIDGFFAGPNGEIDWFKFIEKDDEWEEYTHERAAIGQSILVFGHTTYEMMKGFWPSRQAVQDDPEMAKVVNFNLKLVFSKKISKAEEEEKWKNIAVMNEINKDKIFEMKEKNDMVILGSGSIVQQFTDLNLIDEYSLVVAPMILGKGKPLFKDVTQKKLNLAESRSFKNGITLLRYIVN